MRELLEAIYQSLLKKFSVQTAEDLYHICLDAVKNETLLGVEYAKRLSTICEEKLGSKDLTDSDVMKLFTLHKKVLLVAAPYDFESFLLYVEFEREPKAKFYPPRRKALRQVVGALQDLADGKLDILGISLPPGCGKSTLAIFYLTWMAGKYPNEPILTGSHSNAWTRGAYDECLRIMSPGEYLWQDVFPGVKISSTNAKDCRIDLDRRQRFETLEFTSIGTGNAGLYRASRLLYCDDLVSGLEVALSNERLSKLWDTYTTDLRQRKIGDHCAELHIATRWAVSDVLGRLEQQYAGSDRAKFIVIPALDENDESNFDYQYGVGFNTQFYHEQRAIMDEVSWRALYMNQPIERYGLLYARDELRRYFDLPEGDPDAILAVCDTKDRGEDYCCLPIVYQYGQNFYVEDILCDNGKPEVVEAKLTAILLKHKVKLARFESNSAGGRVAQKIQEEVKKAGGVTHITTKFTTANKETKIITNSPWCKEHLLFKDDSQIASRDYKTAMDMLCGYTMMGKNKHDDVPDAFAQLADFIQSLDVGHVEVFKRPW